jgi:hypothetical protein
MLILYQVGYGILPTTMCYNYSDLIGCRVPIDMFLSRLFPMEAT